MTAVAGGFSGGGLTLDLPFTGAWLTQNSPARRVPSHGTDLLGERYAIDFVGVDTDRRTGGRTSWGTLAGTEPAERFYSFGRPILAPCPGVVVDRLDGEPDHEARRSPLALVPYLLGQRARLQQGIAAVAGNFVILEVVPSRFVALVHLKHSSLLVGIGERVRAGQPLAECGNSGNSTQPHVHVQAMDSRDLSVARGIPITFRNFSEQPTRRSAWTVREIGIPGEGAVVTPGIFSDSNH